MNTNSKLCELLDCDHEGSLTELMREHVRSSAEWRERVDALLAAQDSRMTAVEAQMAQTADVCDGIMTAVSAGKVATKLIKWVGAIALAFGSLMWAIRQTVHGGGGPPPGIGPQ